MSVPQNPVCPCPGVSACCPDRSLPATLYLDDGAGGSSTISNPTYDPISNFWTWTGQSSGTFLGCSSVALVLIFYQIDCVSWELSVAGLGNAPANGGCESIDLTFLFASGCDTPSRFYSVTASEESP